MLIKFLKSYLIFWNYSWFFIKQLKPDFQYSSPKTFDRLCFRLLQLYSYSFGVEEEVRTEGGEEAIEKKGSHFYVCTIVLYMVNICSPDTFLKASCVIWTILSSSGNSSSDKQCHLAREAQRCCVTLSLYWLISDRCLLVLDYQLNLSNCQISLPLPPHSPKKAEEMMDLWP